jgi:hypothetical protein
MKPEAASLRGYCVLFRARNPCVTVAAEASRFTAWRSSSSVSGMSLNQALVE